MNGRAVDVVGADPDFWTSSLRIMVTASGHLREKFRGIPRTLWTFEVGTYREDADRSPDVAHWQA